MSTYYLTKYLFSLNGLAEYPLQISPPKNQHCSLQAGHDLMHLGLPNPDLALLVFLIDFLRCFFIHLFFLHSKLLNTTITNALTGDVAFDSVGDRVFESYKIVNVRETGIQEVGYFRHNNLSLNREIIWPGGSNDTPEGIFISKHLRVCDCFILFYFILFYKYCVVYVLLQDTTTSFNKLRSEK